MTTPPSTLSASHHASSFSSRQRTIALTIVALAFVMDLLDSTIVNIAIPSIQTNLHASYTQIQWVIAGYLLAFATLLITGGRMGDVFGYKRLFMVGVAGFTLASLLSGLAWNPEVLIVARLIQGAMAALMVPQVMSLMQVMYKPEERGSIMGLFGALGGIAATLGPIIGGLLIQWNIAGLDWRPIFLINIPVGIFALAAGARYLPNGKSEHPLKLDLVGTGIVVVAMLLFIFPLIEGRDLGWPAWTFISMAAAIPLLVLFAWYEKRKMARDSSPLVPPALFRVRSFLTGISINFVFEVLFIGYFLIFTLMLQAGLGYSVIKAALTGIPFAIGIGFSIGFLSQKLLPVLGRYLASIGVLVMALGYSGVALLIHHYGLGLSPWQLALPVLLAGLGAGMIMMPIFSVVLADVDVKSAGSASGVLNAIQQVGGAVGIAVIGVIFFGLLSRGAAASLASVVPQLRSDLTTLGVPAQAQDQIISGAKACYTDRVNQKDSTAVPASCQAFSQSQAPSEVTAAITTAAKTANADNFSRAFSWSIVFELLLLALTFGLIFLLPRHIKPESELAV
jgi:EmrB/QacA subfamily drug resistance transporter